MTTALRGLARQYLKSRPFTRLEPPIPILIYRRVRNFRLKSRRRRTNPRWTIYEGTSDRVKGSSEAFAHSVHRTFKLLDLPRAVVDVDQLVESLAALAAQPARYQDASAHWRDTLGAVPAGAFRSSQWRWLSQISGMMGLFRATDVARLKSAEACLLEHQAAGAARDLTRHVAALLLLGRTAEAAHFLTATRRSIPNSRAACVLTHLFACLSSDSRPVDALPTALELDAHLSKLRDVVQGRTVAIIGNSASLLATEVPADAEVVVRLNIYKVLDRAKEQIGVGRALVTYMNSGQSQRLLAEARAGTTTTKELLRRSTLVAVRGVLPRGAPQSLTRPHFTPPLHDHGPVIGNQAVFDCIISGAASIQLVGFDFNQTSLIDETAWQMCRKLGDQGMLNQFQFAQSVHRAGLLGADETGRHSLSLDVSRYACLLEERYGDWTESTA